MNLIEYNRIAWNRQVRISNEWTVPVTPETVENARNGRWSILLTPVIPVPRSWFPDLDGADVLCLASGGGQQGPVLAAAGATVSVFDNSDQQLEQDKKVAIRDGLAMNIVQGDMADLSVFSDSSFDLIVHPVSNIFIPDVNPVWREAYRVLRPGGAILSGMLNPVLCLFEWEEMTAGGPMVVRYKLPYSDMEQRSPGILIRQKEAGEPLEFGHTLDDLIGGQIKAGFSISGFYEDSFAAKDKVPFAEHCATFFATRAVKPVG